MSFWVVLLAALAMGAGTDAGGRIIIHMMGDKLIKLQPIHGCSAETTAVTVIYAASHLGLPVSTTHVISSSIMGVGSVRGRSGVCWGIARQIVAAWILTIPACAITAGICHTLLSVIF